MSAPSVTVLVPSFNRQRYLGEAVRSALGQTFPSWELIILDDGSTDGAAELALQLAASDPRIKALTGQHRGLIANWQAGFAAATGQYVAVLHDDDAWLPSFLASTVSILDRCPDVDWVSTGHMVMDQRGDVLHEASARATAYFGREQLPQGRVAAPLEQVLDRLPFAVGATLFRTSALRSVGFIRLEAGFAFDFDLFLRLAETGRQAYFLPEPLMMYRVHGQQVTSTGGLDKGLALIGILEGRRYQDQRLEDLRLRRLRLAQYAVGASYLKRGDVSQARAYLKSVMRTPQHAARATAGLCMSLLPGVALRRVFAAAAS